jgi:glycosyltransferase involved in cell wall biosynthesis
MRLSIVTGTYNRRKALQNMLQSARNTLPLGIDLEFVVVDGGSTDGTLEWLHQQTDVIVIEHGELRGAIPAFCDGARAAQGKYVVLANDDILFRPHALLAGIVHLENVPTCGGVAFADNRKGAYNPNGQHRVQLMPAWYHDQDMAVLYAQVGMFRKWLGDAVGWWGADDRNFKARTYGGDNYLSARIWEHGYTIDPVEACKVDDLVIDDALRAHNNPIHQRKTNNTDTDRYYQRFPEGTPKLPDAIAIPQQDKRHLRILYLPIYEPGHPIQKQQKCGLRKALQKVGWVYEFDYLASKNIAGEILAILDRWKPDLMLTQLHAPDYITADLARKIRQRYPRLVWVNWNGDYWPNGLTSEPMLKLLRYVSLQLTVNGAVLDTYQQHGIPAAYWQIGYEEPGADLPVVSQHDVVFLANAYHPKRKELETVLRSLEGVNVGLYGSGWAQSDGQCLYDFATGKALYRNAKIAIGDNLYPDAPGFVSNRLFQTMAAGGALLLHQTIPNLSELTGIKCGTHYISWVDTADLQTLIQHYLHTAVERQQIADTGTAFIREQHSFDARVRELFTDLLPLADKPLQTVVGLRYTGRQGKQFSVRGRNGQRYDCNPQEILFVHTEDVDFVMRDGVWERVPDISPDDRLALGVHDYGAK